MRRSNAFIFAIVAIMAVALVALVIWYMYRPSTVVLQGEAVAQSYKVSSKLVGRVDSLTLRMGDKVRQGDFVFSLSTPEVDAKLQQAKALLSAASAKDELAREGLRPQEISAVKSLWDKSKAGLEFAQTTYDRVKRLYEDGVVPAQKLDEAEANLKVMETTEQAAHAQYLIAREGARKEDRKAANALVEQAKGGVREVEAYLKDAFQYSPIDGEVSSIIAEKGELVNAGYPVVTIIDLHDMWFSFNVKETLLPKIKKDMAIEVDVPALGKKVKTRVSYIGAQAQYATWSATRSQGEFDIRTFEVRLTPIDYTDGLRPGMSALFNVTSL